MSCCRNEAPPEWDKVVDAASGRQGGDRHPALQRTAQGAETFEAKFAIDAELVAAPGPKNASRIASERKAGVSYFDAIICGTGTAKGLTHDGMLEPMESYWILPEVKDPKQWWGGHIWEDNISTHRFLYSFFADVSTQNAWYNTTLAKAEDFRSFDD
jgi:hypothetical protein